jgi:N-acetylmuramoyl-L-alanine amidase
MSMCNRLRSLGVWCAVCAAGLSCVGVAAASPRARVSAGQRRAVELTPWEKASQGRDSLEAIANEKRTREDYTRAMNRFRDIYHKDPGDKYAAAAVNAVAELLTEQGRDLKDRKSLEDAVAQYEFLRKQYPGSSLRVSALLAEAQICENDLQDTAAAREKYALFVKDYPHNSQVEEAKAGLASLNRNAKPQRAKTKNSEARTSKPSQATVLDAASASDRAPDAGAFAPMPTTGAAAANFAARHKAVAADVPEPVKTVASQASSNSSDLVKDLSKDSAGIVSGPSHVAQVSASGRNGFAQVTGIRHWSTPNYTRVAIDLGDDVTYEAARVPNPDRIYFDLHGTKLAQGLVGKNFTVTDDGFLKRVRAAQFSNDVTRVVLDVNDVTEYSAFLLPNPYRLIIDVHGSSQPTQQVAENRGAKAPAPTTAPEVKSSPRRPVPGSVETSNAGTESEVAEVSDQPGKVKATKVPTSRPISAVVPSSSTSSRKGRKVVDPASPARAAVPTADGETSLVRALGLKIGRIVIDAGHGGHDSGTIGVDGLEEKDVVLDVALRLGKLLHDRLGSEIIYTRSDDTFIPLETRTAIANKSQADLFLSIHANSSRDSTARGVETYYLNFTSQPDALEVAARENAVSDQSIYQLSDLVKKIALKDKIDESREFASDVESNLYAGLERGNAGLKNRGVKKAPFVVLIGANMPSILAEISFVTNPRDADQLRQPEYRQRVAESLFQGVSKYEAGLSGSRTRVEQAQAVTRGTPPPAQ